MADENQGEGLEKEVYLGNKVPWFLRVAYVAYGAWAVAYLIKYLVPDLARWLR